MNKNSFPDNRFFRRVILISNTVLVWVIVIWTWLSPPEIPAGTVAALGTVAGLNAAGIALYQWCRQRDEEKEAQRNQ